MADFADVVEEIKNTNKKLDKLAQATDPKGAAAVEDKREAASALNQQTSYLKAIADAVSAGGVGGAAAAGAEEGKRGGLLAGIGGALRGGGIGAGAAMGGLGALFAGGGYLLKQLSEFDGEAVKENIMTLLGISDELVEREGGILAAFGETGLLMFTLTGIGMALMVFAAGSAIAAGVEYFTAGIEWSQAIKDNVETLLSIDVEGLGGYLSAIVLLPLALGMLGKGLLKFSIGGAAAAASTAFDNALSMFTGDKEGQGTGWAEEVKKNVETLLGIQIGGSFAAWAEAIVLLPAALGMLGAGLLAFNLGKAAGAAAEGLDDAISMFTGSKEGMGTGWAESVKQEVETLLSIEVGGFGDYAKAIVGLPLVLGALGLGLVAFSLAKVVATGSDAVAGAFTPTTAEAEAGLKQFSTGGWSQTIVDEVTTLLKIADLSFGSAVEFVATMGLIGLGLVAFSAGKVAAGAAEGVTATVQATSNAITQFSTSGFAQTIVNEVTTLLTIADMSFGDAAQFVTTMGLIGAGLLAFSYGKGAAGVAEAINRFAGIGQEGDKSFAQKIKDEVVTLLSIPDEKNVDMAKVIEFDKVMVGLSAGLLVFTTTKFLGALVEGAAGVMRFLTGTKSPVAEMISIADSADDLTKGADALDRLTESLEKIAGLSFDGSDLKMKEFAEDLLESVPAIETAIMGGSVDLSWWPGGNQKFKGLASGEINFAEAISNLNLLQRALKRAGGGSGSVADYGNVGEQLDGSNYGGGPMIAGGSYMVGEGGPEIVIPSATSHVLNAQRTLQMQQASLQKSLGAMGGGGAVLNNMPVSNISTNQTKTTVTATPMRHPSPIIDMVNSAA